MKSRKIVQKNGEESLALRVLYLIVRGFGTIERMTKHIYSQEYTYMSEQERENTKIAYFT